MTMIGAPNHNPHPASARFATAFSERARLLLDHEPDAPPPSSPEALSRVVRTAVEAALDRGETHYTDRPGILALRESIATLLRQRFAIDTNAQSGLIVTCGVTEARFVATQLLLTPGATLAAPARSPDSVAGLFGPALLRRAVLEPIITPVASVVYLTSTTPAAQLRGYLARAPAASTILFEVDEAASTFHPAQDTGFSERTVTIGQLGEESWRIGYLSAPAQFAAAMRDFKQALTICSTNLSQWAVLAALKEESL